MPSGVIQGAAAAAGATDDIFANATSAKFGMLVMTKLPCLACSPSRAAEYHRSFDLQDDLLNQIAEFDIVLSHELRQFLGTARYGVEPAHGECLPEIRIGDDLGDLGIELLDDGH